MRRLLGTVCQRFANSDSQPWPAAGDATSRLVDGSRTSRRSDMSLLPFAVSREEKIAETKLPLQRVSQVIHRHRKLIPTPICKPLVPTSPCRRTRGRLKFSSNLATE